MSELMREKIKSFLENLEIRLANGEIDLQTYNSLKTKWEAKLTGLGGSEVPLPAQAAALAAEGVVVRGLLCSNCGGPLKASGSESRLKCEYCGTLNEVVSAQKEFQQLRASVDSMIRGFGVSGATGAIDKSSRHFIFESKFFPALRLEADQVSEKIPVYMEKPLVASELTEHFSMLQLRSVYKAWNMKERGKPLLNLATKMESQTITDFAVMDEDRKKLSEQMIRCRMLAALSNARFLTLAGTAECYNQAGRFYNDIAANYDSSVATASGDDRIYYELLQNRFRGGAALCDAFAKLNVGDIDEALTILGNTRKLFNEYLGKLRGLAGYEMTAVVPLENGFKRDDLVAAIVQKAAEIYKSMGIRADFRTYIRAVDDSAQRFAFVEMSASGCLADIGERLRPKLDASKLLWFMEQINTAAQVSAGKIKVKAMSTSFDFAKGAAIRCLYPFYLVRVRFTLKKGFWITKRGEEQAFFSMCEGTFNTDNEIYAGNLPSPITPGFKRVIERNIKTPRGLVSLSDMFTNLATLKEVAAPKGIAVIPPTVTPSEVTILYEAAMEMYDKRDVGGYLRNFEEKGFDKNVKSISPEVIGLIYVPLADGQVPPNYYGIPVPRNWSSVATAFITLAKS